ncbi:conserved hypothetical protein [Deferribacter desulfuricans SSM1]|uniref:UPF0251 protein DEFDS_1700 n=1 Tax=Deferribacter desulfuricans (strain DSM 14783 / JCM 11476 / NBRC 101012 / SSM1) TaxID=639282 RepID=D3P8W6_DEFDS|nr:DUF134 domain-containing protein [Deferribacter desulfuricans]BAI81156.1 conserved hypothetical protein [Deferribacter desulfuricans SSM1]
MARPPKKRKVKHRPRFSEFGPYCNFCEHIPVAELSIDQLEAMRLADLEGLSQEEAADKMHVSRQTFGRIVEQARRIVTDALVNGKRLILSYDEHIEFVPREVKCIECGHEWVLADGIEEKDVVCPKCNKSEVIKRQRCGKYCQCPLRINSKI